MTALPILSVVVPTASRPHWLRRAIDSALNCSPVGETEVIVVANGPDDSWRTVAVEFANDPSVRFEWIAVANANAARNLGMSRARGKYIRFLDDDDFLLPAARSQVQKLELEHAEVCSGRILNVDEENVEHGLLSFPDSADFVCRAVSFSGFALPTGHVFLRSAIGDSLWDEKLARRQDYAWMLELARIREWAAVAVDEPVGVWFQHGGQRISHTRFERAVNEPIVRKLANLAETLSSSGRLNSERTAAIADALWHHVHLGFLFDPVYWTGVGRFAHRMAPDSRPPHTVFRVPLLERLHPLLIEWALLPARQLSRLLHGHAFKSDRPTYRRTL